MKLGRKFACRHSLLIGSLLLALFSAPLRSTPVGPEFNVTAAAAGTQEGASVATNPVGGDFVVAWYDAPTNSIYAHHYDADGTSLSGTFLVSNIGTHNGSGFFPGGSTKTPHVAMSANGNYVITFIRGDNSLYMAYHLYSAADALITSANVDAITNPWQPDWNSMLATPRAFMISTGEFWIAWCRVHEHGTAHNFTNYHVHEYDAAGNFVQVVQWGPNHTFPDHAPIVDIAPFGDAGGFSVTYSSSLSFSSSHTYDENGVELFNWPTGHLPELRLATNDVDRVVFAWTSGGDVVLLVRDAPTTFALGPVSLGAGSQPDVEVDGNGDIIVTWTAADSDGQGIYMQRLDFDLNTIEPKTLVNTTETGDQENPAIDIDNSGQYVIAWECPETAAAEGIWAQRFQIADLDSTIGAGALSEPTSIDSVAGAAAPVQVLDFTLTDSGTSDGLSTDLSQLVINVGGTADASDFSWTLDGPDATGVAGVVAGVVGTQTITFSGLSISVADGMNETYVLSLQLVASPTNTSDNETFTFSISDTDLTVAAEGSQVTTSGPVTNGAGLTYSVVATTLQVTTGPAASEDANVGFDVVVSYFDANGNLDTDVTDTLTFVRSDAGTILSTSALAAVAGVVSFTAGNQVVLGAPAATGITLDLSDDAGGSVNIGSVSTSSFDLVAAQDATVAAGAGAEVASVSSVSATPVLALDLLVNDAGTDALATLVTQIEIDLSGSSADATEATWILDGPDAGSVVGVVSGGIGAQLITYSGLSISIADGASETYSIMFALSVGSLTTTDNQLWQVSADSTSFTIGAAGSTFTVSGPIDNTGVAGGGLNLLVIATEMVLQQGPAATETTNAPFDVVVSFEDTNGNRDLDVTDTISLSRSDAGAILTTTSVNAVAGIASFSGADEVRLGAPAATNISLSLSDDVGGSVNLGSIATATFDLVALNEASVSGGPDNEVAAVSSIDTASQVALDFSLSDAGADSLSLFVTQLEVDLSGSNADATDATWILSGPGTNDAVATVTGSVGGQTLTFSGLAIEVLDGTSQDFSVNASLDAGLEVDDGVSWTLAIDHTSFLTSSAGSLFSPSPTVDNTHTSSGGLEIDVIATELEILAQPSGGESGVGLDSDIVVIAVDANGNRDTDHAADITCAALSIAPGPIVAIEGEPTLPPTSGFASFDSLRIDTPNYDEGYLLEFSSAALASVTTTPVLIVFGPPTSLRFIVEPFGAKEGVPFEVQPSVELLDPADNRIDNLDGTVSVTLVSSHDALGLIGTTSSDLEEGVATFVNLGVNKASETLQLQFTLGIASLELLSPAFNVLNGPILKTASLDDRDNDGQPTEGDLVVLFFDDPVNPASIPGISSSSQESFSVVGRSSQKSAATAAEGLDEAMGLAQGATFGIGATATMLDTNRVAITLGEGETIDSEITFFDPADDVSDYDGNGDITFFKVQLANAESDVYAPTAEVHVAALNNNKQVMVSVAYTDIQTLNPVVVISGAGVEGASDSQFLAGADRSWSYVLESGAGSRVNLFGGGIFTVDIGGQNDAQGNVFIAPSSVSFKMSVNDLQMLEGDSIQSNSVNQPTQTSGCSLQRVRNQNVGTVMFNLMVLAALWAVSRRKRRVVLTSE